MRNRRDAEINHPDCRGINDVAAPWLDGRPVPRQVRIQARIQAHPWSAAPRAFAFSTACAAGRPWSCCCITFSSTACRRTASWPIAALWAKVFFLNGTLAVSVFFVISGFSLSIRYLETGDGSGSGPHRRRALFAAGTADLRDLRGDLRVAGVGPHPAGRAAPLPARSVPRPLRRPSSGLLGFSLLKVFVAYPAPRATIRRSGP